ncbi:MAG: asparagine synthase C-terminal domain-containing protein [Candidatus Competibacteraceae bacterium]
MPPDNCRRSASRPFRHFGAEYARENEFVQLMVDRYHTDHHWLEIRPGGFLERLREIIWRLDDPIGDPVTVPNYLLAQAASQVADVVLNGEGGDPCFGGPKNIPMLLPGCTVSLPGELSAGWLGAQLFAWRSSAAIRIWSALLDPALLRKPAARRH